MADKKLSVELTGKDRLSGVFEKSDKTLARLRKTAGDAGDALNKLQQSQSNVRAYREVTGALEATNSALATNAKRTDAATAALRTAQAEQRRYQQGITAAKASLDELALAQANNGRLTKEQKVAQVQARQALKALQPELKKATAEVNAKRREDAAARRETASLNKTLEQQRTRTSQLKETLAGAGVNVSALGKAESHLAGDVDKATHALQRQEKRIKTITAAREKMAANKAYRADIPGQIMGTAVAAAPLVGATKRAIDYQWAWSDVQKAANFKSPEEDKAFQRQMRNKATELGVGQTDIAEMAAAGGQAGIALDKNGNLDVAQLARFTTDTAKAAVALDLDKSSAGQLFADSRKSMNISQDQMMDMADLANYAGNKYGAKAGVTLNIMKRQGANVMKAGFSPNQAAALAASLAAVGETDETGATAMKNIAGRITSGFATTKSARKALGMLGYNPEILAKDMQRNAPKTLMNVLKSVGRQDKDKQKAIISQIFGEEVAGSVAKLAGNTDLLQKTMALAADKTLRAGSMEQEYQVKREQAKAKIDGAVAAIDDATIAVGEMLLPTVGEMAPVVRDLAQGFTDLLEKSGTARTVLKGMLGVVAGFVALKTGVMVFKSIGSLFSDLKQLGTIGKNKLGSTADMTAGAADRAARALARMNKQMDSIGGAGSGASGGGGTGTGKGKKARRRAGQSGPADASLTPAESVKPGRLSRLRNWRRGRLPRVRGGKILARAGKGLMDGVSGLMGGGDDDAPADDGLLSKVSTAVNFAETGVDAALPFLGGTAGKMAGKLAAPLRIAGGVVNIAQAAKNGDAADVGSATGDMAGAWGGMELGAAIGSAIMPGIGTVVGGALGGLAGGAVGSAIGEKAGPWISRSFDTLKGWFTSEAQKSPASAAHVAKIGPTDLAKPGKDVTPAIDAAAAQATALQPAAGPSVKIEHTSHFDIKASGDPAQDNALAQKIKGIIEQLNADLLASGMAAATGGVDARLNASLNGQRND